MIDIKIRSFIDAICGPHYWPSYFEHVRVPQERWNDLAKSIHGDITAEDISPEVQTALFSYLCEDHAPVQGSRPEFKFAEEKARQFGMKQLQVAEFCQVVDRMRVRYTHILQGFRSETPAPNSAEAAKCVSSYMASQGIIIDLAA